MILQLPHQVNIHMAGQIGVTISVLLAHHQLVSIPVRRTGRINIKLPDHQACFIGLFLNNLPIEKHVFLKLRDPLSQGGQRFLQLSAGLLVHRTRAIQNGNLSFQCFILLTQVSQLSRQFTLLCLLALLCQHCGVVCIAPPSGNTDRNSGEQKKSKQETPTRPVRHDHHFFLPASFDNIRHFSNSTNRDLNQGSKATTSSPFVSSKPNMMFIFCTA